MLPPVARALDADKRELAHQPFIGCYCKDSSPYGLAVLVQRVEPGVIRNDMTREQIREVCPCLDGAWTKSPQLGEAWFAEWLFRRAVHGASVG